MGRVFTVDFRRVDPDVRRGQQSYPLAIDGTLYVTTNDNNVFALDGDDRQGEVASTSRGTAASSSTSASSRTAASRYCDGKLFMPTLDMTLVALRPSDGELVGQDRDQPVRPGAVGELRLLGDERADLRERSVVIGAAGSEYGVRGFVMAYNTDLTPAWPNPFWTIPPEQHRVAAAARGSSAAASSGRRSRSTRRRTRSTSAPAPATPHFYHDLRPGPNPRADSLIAVDLNTGKQRWWQQLIANNQWSYDTAQPPLVYDAKVGGKKRRDRLGGDDGRRLVRVRRRAPGRSHQRVKVIDRVEHPPLQPGQPVTVFPSSLGGLNYSPASYDPAHELRLQRRGRDGRRSDPGQADADAEEAEAHPRRRLPRPPERQLRHRPARLARPRLDQRDRRRHRQAGLEVPDAGARARRRHDDRERPRLRRRRRRRPARVRHSRTGRCSGRSRPALRSRPGRRSISSDGKEYLAITVGGTPTSSNGGIAARAAGLRARRQPAAVAAAVRADARRRRCGRPAERSCRRRRRRRRPHALPPRSPVRARLSTGGPIAVRAWLPSGDNTEIASGRLLVGGRRSPARGSRSTATS